MMAPTNQLLLWFAIIVLPCSTVAGANIAARGACVIAILVFAIVALIDAIRALRCLDGFVVATTDVIRMTKGQASGIPLQLRHAATTLKRIRVALNVPGTLRCPHESIVLAVKSHEETLATSFPVTPLQRGRFIIPTYALEGHSPFGFWSVRRRHSLNSEIRVYPDLAAERKKLAPYFLHRDTAGVHSRRYIGQGREFEKLREYMPGDSIDLIHWKATAKRNAPVSKVFQLERTQEVYVALDTSRLSARMTVKDGVETTDTILESFMKSALILALATRNFCDLFGLITFSDQVQTLLRAKGGKSHFDTCREALYLIESQGVSPDFRELSVAIRQRLKKRALIVVLTCLDDPILAEQFTQSMELVQRQHVIIAVSIRNAPPPLLFEESNVTSLDQIYRSLASQIDHQNLENTQKKLGRGGVKLIPLSCDQLSLGVIKEYMSLKQRQRI